MHSRTKRVKGLHQRAHTVSLGDEGAQHASKYKSKISRKVNEEHHVVSEILNQENDDGRLIL
jgi:hypothetical protein